MGVLLAILFATVISQPSEPWKGFERTAIQYDRDADEFRGADLSGFAAATILDERMTLANEIIEEAAAKCTRITSEALSLASEESDRPVVLITADYDVLDAIGRKNLTLVVPEWSFDAATRNVTCRVFTTSILKSPPICEARISTALNGFVATVPCEWRGYGDPAKAVTLQVGDDPDDTFECYELVFTMPESVSEMSVDFSKWGRVGDPLTGFDIGNRQLRVNGELTKTTAAADELRSILAIGTVERIEDDGTHVSLDEFEFFTDNGLTKASLKEKEE